MMTIILVTSTILACLPLLMAAYFLQFTLPRRILSVKQDLGKLTPMPQGATSTGTGSGSSIASEDDIEELTKQFFGGLTLSLPSVLLTGFYVALFALCDAYLHLKYSSGVGWWLLFPERLVDASRPIVYGFVGVYVFNLGTIVRRVYLGDLNEQVFWGAINRLWLALGVTLIIARVDVFEPYSDSPLLYFSIAFLANIALDALLAKALDILKRSKSRNDDLSLQMVKGINMWKEYRLEEEGIENVQNLATADVAELSVRTHYNFRTLIDWIDQAILLSRLQASHVIALQAQATSLSAIEFASRSPKATGNDNVAQALAKAMNVDPVLLGSMMNSLYEDQYVQDLWYLWQSGKEGGTGTGTGKGG